MMRRRASNLERDMLCRIIFRSDFRVQMIYTNEVHMLEILEQVALTP